MPSFKPPRWSKPAPLGYGHAADAAHFVAAPLLVAAGVAMIGVVGADREQFRWPGMTLLFLSIAMIVLVGSIQYGFQARALLYSAGDLEDWWGAADLERHEETLRSRQREEFRQWKIKIGKAVLLYNVGVAMLGAGLSLCVAPPADAGAGEAIPRWIACALVGAAAVAEFGWAVLARQDFQLHRPAWPRIRGRGEERTR
ncbi:hypothetical protein AB0K05_14535 [Nonomuraea sp. NPDC049486]|jgi:hypothetical protein|uniref:hypothetical protein n=1 Tax=unclassified Nonomuraea TaxID=2593643 RepID=UPI00341C6CAE